ncbi:MAG: oligosaccharide flippase family protein [Candidatus Cloacimonetes bacterium]|jgi:O-antigen/teichoic acid export membrane protein|nr:oligosaccharide flippase family protein [Candidatus Cloacimonadota bacterium]MDY0366221.1 oligosaccharide flippase family protein [Candidatus Syntrophosphaera sp.]HOY83867.1 oligosaccharide flippase family protein [Candidatus Syntrophosphaera sp.]
MSTDRSKQAGLLTSVEFIRFGLKSLVGIILARILVPAELGSYRQLFLIYSTFSTLLLLGIPQSVLYFLPKLRHIDSKREFISRAVNLVSALAFVFGLAIFLLRGFIARVFSNPQLELLLILYAVYPLFMFITQIYSQIMLGLKQPGKTAVFTLFSVAADFVLILGVALLTHNLYHIVLALMVSALLQWGFAQFQLRHWLTKASFDPGFYHEVFQYSLPLGLASIIGMLSVQLDKLVISGFFTPAQYAVFSIGAMELPFIAILNNSVNAILLPHISSEPAKMTEVYRAAVRKNALIIFPFAALGLIFAQPLITLLYTETYLGSVPFFRVYLLNLPLRVATYGIIFMALHKTRYIMLNSIITLGLNLVLNLILVRLIGMMGAVIATVIVTWISVAVYLYWMRHKLGLDLKELFPLKALLKTALVAAISALPAYAALWIFGRGWTLQFVALLCYLTAFVILGKLSNAILPYDIAYAQKLWAQLKTRFVKAR